VLSDTNARLAAARRLTNAKARRAGGRLLVEGPTGIEAALAAGSVLELFFTAAAHDRQGDLVERARARGIAVDEISDRAAAALSETVTAPGIVAVCTRVDVDLDTVLAGNPRLVVVLVDTNDPGNAGAIVRTADAAGAAAVIACGGVDLYNGKAVRATAGSLFNLPIVLAVDAEAVVARLQAGGLSVLATSGAGRDGLDTLEDAGDLIRPTAWIFGSEAHGLPPGLMAAADRTVRIPIYGRAESLNLAAAAAVCLYASARAQRRNGGPA
jgi:TrmH family RNA methyltransferase